MNGIFTDFDSYYALCAPYDPDQRHRWHEVITHVRIYDRLEIIEGSYELAKYFMGKPEYNPEILTSTESAVPKLYVETQLQRTRWLMRHGITLSPIFVYSQFDKAKYANENTVLISANHIALSAFAMKGGNCIKHVDVKTTIEQFEQLIKT